MKLGMQLWRNFSDFHKIYDSLCFYERQLVFVVFEIHFCPLCQEEGFVGEQASIMTYVLFSVRM